jgi:hypothetical protein
MKCLALLCALVLAACGGGDPETMPCKYRPDCAAGPPG